MRIGLYLAYEIHRGASQSKEGLGRYWVMLLKHLTDRGHFVTVATLPWARQVITRQLEGVDLDRSRVSILTPRRTPALWRVLGGMRREKKPLRFGVGSVLNLIVRVLDGMLDLLARIHHLLLFVLVGLLYVALGIVLLPVGLLLGVCLALFLLAAKAAGMDIRTSPGRRRMMGALRSLRRLPQRISFSLLGGSLSPNGAENLRKISARDLRQEVLSLEDPMDLWYCPMAYWPEFFDLPGVKALCFPDLVTTVFPYGFTRQGNGLTDRMTHQVRQTVQKGTYFVVYSQYQKEAVLVNQLGKRPQDIAAIDLFANETRLDLLGDWEGAPAEPERMRLDARAVLQDLCRREEGPETPYLSGALKPFDMRGMRYIFYASQFRASKNVLNLVRAYHMLQRRGEVPFKLVLTGVFVHDGPLFAYVQKHGLENDVLTFSGVSNRELAALYACAELAVTPTLFEGGFPMTFYEGMSVGTPSILARIPQVTELFAGQGLDDCLFDPFDPLDLAEKIRQGVQRREELVRRQRPLYLALREKTKNELGRAYEEAFLRFIQAESQEVSAG